MVKAGAAEARARAIAAGADNEAIEHYGSIQVRKFAKLKADGEALGPFYDQYTIALICRAAKRAEKLGRGN